MRVGKKLAPRFHVGEVVAFLYGPQKVPGEILEDRGPLGAFGHRIYRVRFDRGQEGTATLEIPEANIVGPWRSEYEGEEPGLRQEFEVVYTRKGHTRSWTAAVSRGRLYKGVRAKGAVGYTTGRWEGERDETRAVVTVFVECETTVCDAHAHVRPESWPALEKTAISLADQMFKTRHPEAAIEHVDNISNC